MPTFLTDNRFRLILGSGLLFFGLLNGGLYYHELALAAQSRSDIQELNVRATEPSPSPTVSVKPQATPAPTPVVAATAQIPKVTSPKPTAALPSASKKIHITTATEADFDSLPGIGPSKAKAIVDYRTLHPFTAVTDIKNVKGIGDKTFTDLEPYLEL
jgi:competence ComEA-like helix-hairpin-helix protein